MEYKDIRLHVCTNTIVCGINIAQIIYLLYGSTIYIYINKREIANNYYDLDYGNGHNKWL